MGVVVVLGRGRIGRELAMVVVVVVVVVADGSG